MYILKAFTSPSKIIPFLSIPVLLSYLKLAKRDLVIIEKRILEVYKKEFSSCRIIVREDYERGPVTDTLIQNITKDAGADFDRVIGIGGGGTMEIAKILSLQDILPLEALFEDKDVAKKARKLILVPTTPGTGTEATHFVSVLFTNDKVQRILNSDAIGADEILLCPRFLKGIPFKVLAASSFVSFVHATEGFASPLATAHTRALAEKSINTTIRIWKHISTNGIGSLEEEYENLQNAGNIAGIVLGNSGGAAVPALAYPLNIRLKIPYGEALYLVFFKIIETYLNKSHSKALEDLIEILSKALHCKKEEVLQKLSALCDGIIEHKHLQDYGMTEKNVLEFTDLVLTRRHMLIANSNDQLTPAEIAKIYKNLL